MAHPWQAWVHEVLEQPRQDAFVELLRTRLSAGERVVRIELNSSDGLASPSYRVILARGPNLSELVVPHSASFTRFSLEAGLRLDSHEAEAGRFATLLAERLHAMGVEWGEAWLRAVLVHQLRSLAPPRTRKAIEGVREYEVERSAAWARAVAQLNGTLAELARALAEQLHYSEAEAADLLDRALEKVVAQHLRMAPLAALY